MPWLLLPSFEATSSIAPSFMPNNLASDGDGRLAYAQGNRVRCIRRMAVSSKPNDFSLAYSEKIDVTAIHWWTGVEKYNRPLLVITTESTRKSPATVQVWSLGRGAGSRIFRCELSDLEKDGLLADAAKPQDAKPIRFARGLAQASSNQSGQILFCGTNTGSVHGLEYRHRKVGGITRVCTMTDLTHPLACLAGDRRESDLLAAADETGNLVVWSVKEELDRDGTNNARYRTSIVYKYHKHDDFFTCIGVRDNIVVVGHKSGCLTFHDTEREYHFASVVANAKAVTCIDVYEDRNLVLVGGEDGRVTAIGFSEKQSFKPVVHFSVAFESTIIGCAFSNLEGGLPRIAMLTWETCTLKQFEYKRSKNKKEKGVQQETPETPRSISAYSCVVDDTLSPVAACQADIPFTNPLDDKPQS